MASLYSANIEAILLNSGIILGIITYAGLGVLHYLRYYEKLTKGHGALFMVALFQCFQWVTLIVGRLSPHYSNPVNFCIMAIIPTYYSIKWIGSVKQHISSRISKLLIIVIYFWLAIFLLMGLVQVILIGLIDFALGSISIYITLIASNAITGTGLVMLVLLIIWFHTLLPKNMVKDSKTSRMLYRLMLFLILTLLCIISTMYLKYFIHPFIMMFYHLIALIPSDSLDEFEELSKIYIPQKHDKTLAYPFAHHGILPSTVHLPTIGRVSTLRIPVPNANKSMNNTSAKIDTSLAGDHVNSMSIANNNSNSNSNSNDQFESDNSTLVLSIEDLHENYTVITGYEAMESDEDEIAQISPVESIEITIARPIVTINTNPSDTSINCNVESLHS
ncbi:hypothetical protein BDF22DRAFT_733552 [Syncephalis plumigaleata]|nr:hypothetical protein BDF22DRAFT_733552 [Syncephalis plumigaleata]